MTSLTSQERKVYNHNKIHYWQLQDAKARLSELVRLATSDGPQGISIRGQNEVVVISAAAYAELTQPKMNFFSFMQKSPLKGLDLNITRDKSTDRDIDI